MGMHGRIIAGLLALNLSFSFFLITLPARTVCLRRRWRRERHAHDLLRSAICFMLKRIVHGTNGELALHLRRGCGETVQRCSIPGVNRGGPRPRLRRLIARQFLIRVRSGRGRLVYTGVQHQGFQRFISRFTQTETFMINFNAGEPLFEWESRYPRLRAR
jgi:hypothetical protein